MSILKYSLGTDVDSQKLKCCLGSIDTEQVHKVHASKTFENNRTGFGELLGWLKKHCKAEGIPVVVTMEVTGVYHEQFANYVDEAGYTVNVVLPNRSKKYMEGIGYKSKTDEIDAQGLSRMGAEQSLSKWKPVSKAIYELRGALRYREELTVMLTGLRNQKHAQDHMQYPNEEVLTSQKGLMEGIKGQIKAMDQKIKQLVSQEKEMKRKVDQIVGSINGVGFLTVVTLVAETNGFEMFSNQRQLTSYSGYDVVENQSAKRVGKTRMSKQGNRHIRRILHMPALNVVRRETGNFKQVYERIFHRSFIKMKAYVAIQRKLLCLIYTLWKKDVAFDKNYTHPTLQNKNELVLAKMN